MHKKLRPPPSLHTATDAEEHIRRWNDEHGPEKTEPCQKQSRRWKGGSDTAVRDHPGTQETPSRQPRQGKREDQSWHMDWEWTSPKNKEKPEKGNEELFTAEGGTKGRKGNPGQRSHQWHSHLHLHVQEEETQEG